MVLFWLLLMHASKSLLESGPAWALVLRYFIDNHFRQLQKWFCDSIVFFSHKLLGPQTPKASITDPHLPIAETESFSLNLACFACASALTPNS
jgi:hypothetical protein